MKQSNSFSNIILNTKSFNDSNNEIKFNNNDTINNESINQSDERHNIDIIDLNKRNKLNFDTIGGSLFEDIRHTYKFEGVLGGGTFASVRTAYKINDPEKKLFAIKSISKKNMKKKDQFDLIKEVEILSYLDHPNIIKFYETYHDQYYFHIVMELCKGKELFDKLVEHGHINEFTVAKIIYKVISAIFYCHNNGISHRDIKPENILFESDDVDGEIKLVDFGLSTKYENDQKMHSILGTAYYIAPEVLLGSYNQKCDIWSIGAIAYIMLSGQLPFNGKSNHEIYNKIINNQIDFTRNIWESVSENCKDFIEKCLIKNPDLRISSEEAINHPWFSAVINEIHKTDNLNKEMLENLKNFSSPSRFKKLILRFLVNQLSQNDIKKLRKTFCAIDLNHHGTINIFELENAFKISGINVSKEELRNILNSADDRNNGVIDYSEFLVACMNQKKIMDKENLISAFEYFDIDNSGYICSSDIKYALLRYGKKVLNNKEIDSMLIEVSNMNKNKISLEEFLDLFDIN